MMLRRRIGRYVWALSIATLVNRSTGFLGLFAAIFFSETGMAGSTVVIALLTVGVAGVCGSLLGGRLADRFGEKPILVGSTAVNTLLFAALAVADYSLSWWVVATSAISVLTSQTFVGPASALVAESADGRDRVTRFAFYRIFINIGSIVAPALVGLIGRDHFDVLFWLSAGSSALLTLFLAWGLSKKSAHPTLPENPRETGKAKRGITPPESRQYSALLSVYVAMMLAWAVYAQHQSAVPLRLDTEPHGLQLYSLLLIINPVIVLLIEYPLSHLTRRMPAHAALALGVVVMGLGVALTGRFADHPTVAISGWVLFSIGECVFAPMAHSYVADLSPGTAPSRSQGRLAAYQSVGSALGPGIGSWMLLSFAGATWIGFLIVTVVSAALVLTAHAAGSRVTRRQHVSASH